MEVENEENDNIIVSSAPVEDIPIPPPSSSSPSDPPPPPEPVEAAKPEPPIPQPKKPISSSSKKPKPVSKKPSKPPAPAPLFTPASRVKVLVRCRPRLPTEDGKDTDRIRMLPDHNSITLQYPSQHNAAALGLPSSSSSNNSNSSSVGAAGSASIGSDGLRTFNFDGVLDSSCSQSEVFSHVEPLITSVLDGYHATVFAYGQTGSGKTFSMEGFDYKVAEGKAPRPLVETPSDQWGIIPRTIDHLFEDIKQRHASSSTRYRVRCSFVQLYNERVFDLLNPACSHPDASKHVTFSGNTPSASLSSLSSSSASSSTVIASASSLSGNGLRVRWSKDSDFYVENLFIYDCETPQQVRELFSLGVGYKVMGSHRLNRQSSRSHCLFTLYVDATDPIDPDYLIRSKLTLVDLAGSERVANLSMSNDGSAPPAKLMKESIDINMSLFALAKVITALSPEEGASNINSLAHVPYRDSKLTQLLKHSLGGNSMTLMLACVSPLNDFVDENMNTMTYASRVRNIQNHPIKNEDPKVAMIQKLRDEISGLKNELKQLRSLQLDALQSREQEKQAKEPEQPEQKQGNEEEEEGENNNKDMSTVHAAQELTAELQKEDQKMSLRQRAFLADKLVDTVRILKELIDVNGRLRSSFDAVELKNKSLEANVVELMEENARLRDKTDMLDSLLASAARRHEKEEKEQELRARENGFNLSSSSNSNSNNNSRPSTSSSSSLSSSSSSIPSSIPSSMTSPTRSASAQRTRASVSKRSNSSGVDPEVAAAVDALMAPPPATRPSSSSVSSLLTPSPPSVSSNGLMKRPSISSSSSSSVPSSSSSSPRNSLSSSSSSPLRSRPPAPRGSVPPAPVPSAPPPRPVQTSKPSASTTPRRSVSASRPPAASAAASRPQSSGVGMVGSIPVPPLPIRPASLSMELPPSSLPIEPLQPPRSITPRGEDIPSALSSSSNRQSSSPSKSRPTGPPASSMRPSTGNGSVSARRPGSSSVSSSISSTKPLVTTARGPASSGQVQRPRTASAAAAASQQPPVSPPGGSAIRFADNVIIGGETGRLIMSLSAAMSKTSSSSLGKPSSPMYPPLSSSLQQSQQQQRASPMIIQPPQQQVNAPGRSIAQTPPPALQPLTADKDDLKDQLKDLLAQKALKKQNGASSSSSSSSAPQQNSVTFDDILPGAIGE